MFLKGVLSSPIQIIESMPPIQKARLNYENITNEYTNLLTTFKNFETVLHDLSEIQSPKLNTVKNTSFDALITEHLSSLHLFVQSFLDFSACFREDYRKIANNFQLRQYLKDTVDEEIKTLDKIITHLLLDLNNRRKQIKQKASDLYRISKDKNRAQATEQLRIEYPKHVNQINHYKSIKAKAKNKLNELRDKIKTYFEFITKLNISFQTQLIADILFPISKHLAIFGDNLEQSISKLVAQTIDFNRDFTLYAQKLNIEFSEVEVSPFQKHTNVKTAGAKLQTSKEVNAMPFNLYKLPEFISRLKANFKGENSNELNVRKNQKVGVLKTKDNFQGWTLCINLFTLEIGYVPTEFLEPVGIGIGVIKSSMNIDNFYGDEGRLVSYIDDEDDSHVLVEDYCGNRASVSKEDVIIIHSKIPFEMFLRKPATDSDENKRSSRNYLSFNPSLYKDLSDYEEIDEIGRGNFSVVKKYKDKKSGEFYAFKVLEMFTNSESPESKRAILELRREIIISSSFNHPTLNSLFGIIDAKERYEFIIITPFYKEGDLATMIGKEIDKEAPKEWDFTQKYIVMYGIACGMYILHEQDLIHRDLKPGNILLDENFEPKISDFGLSKLVDQGNSMKQTLAPGTPIFAAPEVLKYQNEEDIIYDGKKADVFSFSILCYQLFTLLFPYSNLRNQYELVNFVTGNGRPSFPEDFNPSLAELIIACWNQEGEERPSFENILEVISSEQFIKQVGGIDVERFLDYQNKVAPDAKFITTFKEEEETDEEELKEELKEMPTPFKIDPSLVKEESDYEKVEPIGKGRYGLVFKCKDVKTGEFVAIKRVGVKFDDVQLQREIWVLSTFHHPAIHTLHGIIQTEKNISFMLITPFYQQGNLVKMIDKENKQISPENWDLTQKYIVMYGIAAGMLLLHRYNVIHRDLKTDNILLTDDLEPIITDFGLSKMVDQYNTLFQTSAYGTPSFMAPEIIFSKTQENGVSYDGKFADVYSFAMLCYQLFSGIYPFKNAVNQYQLARLLEDGQRPSIPAEFSESIKGLIEDCWSQDPLNRPTFDKIVEQLSNPSFIRSVGDIDIDRFIAYQKKVVPRKYQKICTAFSQNKKSQTKEPEVKRDAWRRSPSLLIKEMADSGDKESSYNYGCILLRGSKSRQTLLEASLYFKQSADAGYVSAIIQYAKMLKEGLGMMKDETKAFQIMQSAAETGDSEAQYNLGLWLVNSHPPQYASASAWLKKAADNERPDPEAPALYASLLEKGRLGSIPRSKVITQYYKKASDLGSPKGMYHMALLYHSGENEELPKDVSEAMRLYELAAQEGIQDAILSLSYAYEEVGQNEEALNNAIFYAEKDNFIGYLRLYEIYKSQNKDELSNKYLRLASEKRFSNSQCHVSVLYSHGKGVPQDKDKAFFWAEKSARNGLPEGCTKLASIYYKKQKDDPQSNTSNLSAALDWASRAAEHGDVEAFRLLAKIYKKLGDDEKETQYLRTASQCGDEQAMLELAEKLGKQGKFAESVEWKRKAAENMNAEACFAYGMELIRGEHVKKDAAEGVRFVQLAADLNNVEAVRELARLYANGSDEVEKNEEKAAKMQEKLKELENSSQRKKRKKKTE